MATSFFFGPRLASQFFWLDGVLENYYLLQQSAANFTSVCVPSPLVRMGVTQLCFGNCEATITSSSCA